MSERREGGREGGSGEGGSEGGVPVHRLPRSWRVSETASLTDSRSNSPSLTGSHRP